MIDLKGSEVTLSGPLFRPNGTKMIRKRMGEYVERLAVEGAKMVRARLAAGIKRSTGFTSAGVEGFSYKAGRPWGSLYGKVRMREGLSRGTGSAGWPSDRVPYVVNAVLESAGYGGAQGAVTSKRTGKTRNRWIAGKRHSRTAVRQWRSSYRELKALNARASVDLTRDLD